MGSESWIEFKSSVERIEIKILSTRTEEMMDKWNYKGAILEHFAKLKKPPPLFEVESTVSGFICKISWRQSLETDAIEILGTVQSSKKKAEQVASYLAEVKLREIQITSSERRIVHVPLIPTIAPKDSSKISYESRYFHSVLQPREYQIDLFQRAMQENVIIGLGMLEVYLTLVFSLPPLLHDVIYIYFSPVIVVATIVVGARLLLHIHDHY